MLAREGRLPLLVFALLGLGAAHIIGVWWSLPFWLIGVGVGYFFRMPSAPPIDLPLAVVSPTAGVIEAVEPVYDPWFSRPALRIRIGLPFPGICVVFSPADGKIEGYWTDLSGSGADHTSPDGWLKDRVKIWN